MFYDPLHRSAYPSDAAWDTAQWIIAPQPIHAADCGLMFYDTSLLGLDSSDRVLVCNDDRRLTDDNPTGTDLDTYTVIHPDGTISLYTDDTALIERVDPTPLSRRALNRWVWGVSSIPEIATEIANISEQVPA